MKKSLIAGLFLLAACSQGEADKAAKAPAAPQGLMEQAQVLPAEQQPIFALQQLQLRTDLQPPCQSVRRAESRGVIPPDVTADSVYGGHAGSLAFAIQCGQQLTTAHDDPREHWLVILQSGATDAFITSCRGADGFDRCIGPIPRASAAP